MPVRNNKSKPPNTFLRKIVLWVFLAFFATVLYQKIFLYLKNSDYFKIKTISYHPSLKFMISTDLLSLKGKNLLDVDLSRIQRQLQGRYPQAANLKVVKRFPNQVLIVARQRFPFARVKMGSQTVVVDEEGVILSELNNVDGGLPIITGINNYKGKIVPGSKVKSHYLRLAGEIIKSFTSVEALEPYRIIKMDVSNLSQIDFYITGDLKVIVDRDDIDRQMQLLGLVLVQGKAELPTVKYVDLRFKEPIFGKK